MQQTPPTAVHHPERQLQRLLSQVALPEKSPRRSPVCGTTRHQPVVHPLAASQGMPMDLHGRPSTSRYIVFFRLFFRGRSFSGVFAGERRTPSSVTMVQDRKVLLRLKRVLGTRSCDASPRPQVDGSGSPPASSDPEAVGVGLVLPQQQASSPQQIRQRIGSKRVSGILGQR